MSKHEIAGPLYVYNGPSNLKDLERVNLAGARLFFNGSYDLRDLRKVNLIGAAVFMTGQATSSGTLSPPSILPSSQSQPRSRSPPRRPSPERRHSDYYRPHDDFYRPNSRYEGPRPGSQRPRFDATSESSLATPHKTSRAMPSSPASRFPARSVERTTLPLSVAGSAEVEPPGVLASTTHVSETGRLSSPNVRTGRLSPYHDIKPSKKEETVSAKVHDECQLIVQGLVPAVTKGHLRTLLSGFNIVSISLPLNPHTCHHDGNGCVVLGTAAEAEKAVRELSGKHLCGRKISFTISPRSNPNLTPIRQPVNDSKEAVGFLRTTPLGCSSELLLRKRNLSPPRMHQEEKRMKIESTSNHRLSEKANSLTAEEITLRLKQRILTNLGRTSNTEDRKIRELSLKRERIKSQLLEQSGGKEIITDSLLSPASQNNNGVQAVADGSAQGSPDVLRLSPSQSGPLLPQVSPLQNVMNFAGLEEEIVQTKIQYAMAEKTLRLERQALGRATEGTIERVKAMGKALAELYEKRGATPTDRELGVALRMTSNGPLPIPRSGATAEGARPSKREGENGLQNGNQSGLDPQDAHRIVVEIESDHVEDPEEGEIREDHRAADEQNSKQ